MPKYKRKKEAKYSLADLIEAVEKVRQKKMNSYEASVQYEIPRSTIIHRLYGTRGAKQPTPGRPPELSKEWETKVASNLHVMEKCGYPLTSKEVKLLVSNYIKRNGIITRFKDDYPGKEWFRGFKRRHKLSLKMPQSVELARKKACNPFTVYNYFELLEQATQELGLTDKPQCLYNLDETSFCSDPTKTKVVGLMGFPSTRTTASPGRNNTTVLLAANAAGEKIPPLLIFQGKHLWSEWLFKNENVDTAYAVSRKGWMETTIFEQYIKSVFLPAIGAERPILLVYDGHSTHVDLSVIELLVANQITVLNLPAHSSHILQPLDCSTMKPMKDSWDRELVKWQRLHVGAKLPKQEFARIITMIWDNLNPVIIQNGFRKAGIYPLNRNAIPKEKFDNLTWSRWEEHLQEQNKPSCSYTQKVEGQKENKVLTLISVCLKIINREVLLPEENNPVIASMTQDMKEKNIPTEIENDARATTNTSEKMDRPLREGTQISSQYCVKDPKTFKLPRPKNTNSNSALKILDIKVINPTDNKNKEKERVSFEELLLKTISRNDIPKSVKKRVSQGAEILTHRDVLDRLKKQKEEKEKADEKKQLSKLKRASNTKNKKPRKNKMKANKNKRKKNLESDSESDCSYRAGDPVLATHPLLAIFNFKPMLSRYR